MKLMDKFNTETKTEVTGKMSKEAADRLADRQGIAAIIRSIAWAVTPIAIVLLWKLL